MLRKNLFKTHKQTALKLSYKYDIYRRNNLFYNIQSRLLFN